MPKNKHRSTTSDRSAGAIEINSRELAGSLGDLGTLLPLTIGYITVCKMNPAGLLVMTGLANIATGIVYRLPMPIEPMKVLAVVAIVDAWSPEKVYTAALVMGLVWLLMGATGAITRIARWTPASVVLGIQISLGILLAVEGVKMAGSWWALGLLAAIVAIVLRNNRFAPAAIVLVAAGIAIMAWQGKLVGTGAVGFSLPPLTAFDPREIWPVLRDGGLAQIPLTAANAVIATSALISEYWPERRVSERRLALSTGAINTVLAFFGGMPLCHGAGGLAGQYYFGARSAGANIIEGTIEIALGLAMAGGVATLLAGFPLAIVGAMMFLVGIELLKRGTELRWSLETVPVAATVAGALAANMAVGFAAGVAVAALLDIAAAQR